MSNVRYKLIRSRSSRYLKGESSAKDSAAKEKKRMEKIAYSLEHSRFLDYIDYTNKPRWIFWRNFMIGVARGVGLTIGTAIIIAIAIKILQHLISMNIPFLTDMLVEFVQFIKDQVTTVK
ncbi:MAG: hypothetical protein IKD08_01825 [Alphaproteobacteria bacterium]|nr:hypothetical protein [Alphaproteobacteria bacterium]